MKRIIAMLLTLCSLISLCSCGGSVDVTVREKYKKLTDTLENKRLYDAYLEFYNLTKDFKEETTFYPQQEYTSKELEEYMKNVTEVKITKHNLLEYFEIINQEELQYNEFNEVENVNIKTVLRLKEGFYLADTTKCQTSIITSFTATMVRKFYTLDTKSGLLTIGDFVPDLNKVKKTETLQTVVSGKSTYLGCPFGNSYYGSGKAIDYYINIKPTAADGTLYLIDEPDKDDAEDKYKAMIDALNNGDVYNAEKEFIRLTENARKEKARKEYEEYKKKVTEVEINYNNLLDYFEFVNLREFEYNDFNEVESVFIKTVLRLKKEFTLADTEKFITRIEAEVGVTETTRIFHFDKKSNTFTLKGYAPRSNMNVHLRDYEITITKDSADVLIPYSADVDSNRYYIQLGENGRVFSASGKLYLVNN